MNISDFLITLTVSLLAGVGIGLTIKELWCFFVNMMTSLLKPRSIKNVDFAEFFGDHSGEHK